jgi:hypothetical protein
VKACHAPCAIQETEHPEIVSNPVDTETATDEQLETVNNKIKASGRELGGAAILAWCGGLLGLVVAGTAVAVVAGAGVVVAIWLRISVSKHI